MQHATDFATTGSRTLVMSSRVLPEQEWNTWKPKLNDAETSLEDRENKIEQTFRSIEHQMRLVGCSAVDDQLQELVPQTIDFLIAAEIKIIVLTGDKLETAVTIARQSHLVKPGVTVLFVSGVTQDEVSKSLNDAMSLVAAEKEQSESVHSVDNSPTLFAMAIDGVALEISLRHLKDLFRNVFDCCETIVSYRSTPLQKALCVKMCKTELDKTTLAIGDGANDVSMIQESHVGIGIYGKEGAHAAMSSDFVLYRFHHLKRLLILHGRWSYWRTTQVVLLSFYKNLVFPLPLFWFQFWAAGSGTTMYDALLITLFNTFFTSIPPIVVGIVDKDVRDETLLRYPIAYPAFRREDPLTIKIFAIMAVSAIYQSTIIYFIAYGIFGINDVIQSNGRVGNMYVMGDLVCTCVVAVTNLYMLFGIAWITWLNLFALFIGVLLYICTFLFMNYGGDYDLSPDGLGIGGPIFTTPTSWLYLIVAVVLSLGPTATYSSFQRLYYPYTYQVLQRVHLRSDLKSQRMSALRLDIDDRNFDTEKKDKNNKNNKNNKIKKEDKPRAKEKITAKSSPIDNTDLDAIAIQKKNAAISSSNTPAYTRSEEPLKSKPLSTLQEHDETTN